MCQKIYQCMKRASDVCRNLKESINRISQLTGTVSLFFLDLHSSTIIFLENEIYFSLADGIQENSPLIFVSFLINKRVS